jgi:RNA polymerase sigma factor (sigma-70 family)
MKKRGHENRETMSIEKRLADSSTNLSLLANLAAGRSASDSWPIFVEKYGRLLVRWGQRWGARPEDCDEIIQETLILAFRNLHQYQSNPKSNFRSWLKTLAFRCWQKVRDDMQRLQGLDLKRFDAQTLRLLGSTEACKDLLVSFDAIARLEILNLATKRVQNRVNPETWLCFELMHVEKLTGKEVAERLMKSKEAVFKNVFQVRTMLKAEILAIDSEFQF